MKIIDQSSVFYDEYMGNYDHCDALGYAMFGNLYAEFNAEMPKIDMIDVPTNGSHRYHFLQICELICGTQKHFRLKGLRYIACVKNHAAFNRKIGTANNLIVNIHKAGVIGINLDALGDQIVIENIAYNLSDELSKYAQTSKSGLDIDYLCKEIDRFMRQHWEHVDRMYTQLAIGDNCELKEPVI